MEKSGRREIAKCEMSAETGQGLFWTYTSANRTYNSQKGLSGKSKKNRGQLGKTLFLAE